MCLVCGFGQPIDISLISKSLFAKHLLFVLFSARHWCGLDTFNLENLSKAEKTKWIASSLALISHSLLYLNAGLNVISGIVDLIILEGSLWFCHETAIC